MSNAKHSIKLDTSTACARAIRSLNPELTLPKAPQDDDYYHIYGNGVRQQNPPRVNMLKTINHIAANRGKLNEGKHLKFPIVSHPKGPYNHHLVVRVDTEHRVLLM